jgi:hypothetical protein
MKLNVHGSSELFSRLREMQDARRNPHAETTTLEMLLRQESARLKKILVRKEGGTNANLDK